MNMKCVAAFFTWHPVPFSDDVEPPKPPNPDLLYTWTTKRGFTDASNFQDPEWMSAVENYQPKSLTQDEMDYIVPKLGLSQRNSETLTSFLKCRKLTKQDVHAAAYRKRQAEFQELYTVGDQNAFICCNDINGPVNKLRIENIAGDCSLTVQFQVWRLCYRTKQIKNWQSIPLASGTNMKKTCETLDNILKNIRYHVHKWKIC